MSLRDDIIRLAQELEQEQSAAFQLWSWLPSCKAAERAHGDYASEHQPSLADIMREASMFISHGLKPTPQQIEEAGNYYKCPCGECGES
ncbi:hypothetical protein HW932_18410 [Allochromatium humboldtianum]|uniref:Uncharacterized protein n=1 Tax=Allochromatium humboldtianum TaxID=504901 RepID=A0A850RIE0_9GAMM|nr:hypothetical protein [Allochromatium humboldtianum]NVZ11227.1 hypothetical protein [Allochromatium humboldtianum]